MKIYKFVIIIAVFMHINLLVATNKQQALSLAHNLLDRRYNDKDAKFIQKMSDGSFRFITIKNGKTYVSYDASDRSVDMQECVCFSMLTTTFVKNCPTSCISIATNCVDCWDVIGQSYNKNQSELLWQFSRREKALRAYNYGTF